MKRRVVVTGLGAITPVGNDVATTWRALVDGVPGAAPITKFDATNFPVKFAVSNCVMGPTPFAPSRSARHVVATSLPTGESSPSPVMTTRRFTTRRPSR